MEQVSQAELQRREEIERWLRKTVEEDKLKTCVASMGKTLQTLDRNDPQQEAVFRKCMWPEESRNRLRQVWDKILGMW